MSDGPDTIKIRTGFQSELEQAEKDFAEQPSLEKMSRLRWLRGKVAFLNSPWYRQYKQENGQVAP